MIKLQNTVSGRFKIEKYKADSAGNPILESKEVAADWFENLILDQGMDGLGGRSINSSVGTIHVGSGSGEPGPSDTGLDDPVATTSSNQDTSSGWHAEEPYYIFRRISRRFSAGAAAGNLSELGAGWGSGASQLFSRALILDAQGNPTTITVLNDEVLDVTYEIRVYPDITDTTGTIELEGVVYDYIARAARVGASGSGGEYWSLGSVGNGDGTTRAYEGNIRDFTSFPVGSGGGQSLYSSSSRLPYAPGSMVGAASYTWGLGSSPDGGVRSVSARVGWASWQIEFSSQIDGSPIPKDNTKELTLTVSHSWARRAD